MLKIQDLWVNIGEKQILKGVSLKVNPGEIHAVMGPNGSGKSTLAYTLAGHPSYKVMTDEKRPVISMEMDGVDLLDKSPDERARLGLFLAFQYPVEIPGVRVTRFLKAAYDTKGEGKGKFNSVLEFHTYLEELAEKLEVKPELLKRNLNEGFSGGEKKRLEILQMAVLEPKYAVLDETDSGLDIDAVQAVASGVNKIVRMYKCGVIVITHYQRILKYLQPDVVHVMVEGKIVESGGKDVAKRLEKEGYKAAIGGKNG